MYQWKKDIVSWKILGTLYISIPFTWLFEKAKNLAISHKGKVIIGGPGAVLLEEKVDWARVGRDTCFDVLSFHNPLATFTTRGCIHKCLFCAVPELEGSFRELKEWKKAPIVCDNNILASSRTHFERVVESLMDLPYVDFNQGLDARLFTEWHASQLKRLKKVKIRFAFDFPDMERKLDGVLWILNAAGFNTDTLGIYVLIGFEDIPEEARYKLERVRSWGIWPNPMRYQPLDCLRKNDYVAPGWTEGELKKMMRYYSRLAWLDGIRYEDYYYKEKRKGLGLI